MGGLRHRAGFPLLRRSLAAASSVILGATGLAACDTSGAQAAGPLTYYVSPAGNDAAAGTSPATAWRTLSRADSAVLRPGTRLELEGGKQFTGPLAFTRGDGGNASRPVRVGSYGRGRATITAPSGSGIIIDNTAGIEIKNLIVVGQHSPPSGEGINLYNNLAGSPKLDHVVIDHVNVSGFANGIAIVGGRGTAGFRDVLVRYSALHDNLANGLLTYGPTYNPAHPAYAQEHLSLWHVAAYRNFGDPAQTQHNSGSGIVLGSVRGATVAWSTAYSNGGRGGAVHNGPQGIWAYDSTGVVIEHDLAYNNRAIGSADGGGFDLDQNTSHSIMEYNLSYGNSGPGYLVYNHLQTADKGDVVRFNISSGDTVRNATYAGIQVTGRLSGAAIYQNTVIMPRRAGTSSAMALLLGKGLAGTTIRNNIFLTYQRGYIVYSREPLRRSAVLLQGNDYFSTSGRWVAWWGGTNYYSLAGFRARTGQEKLAGRTTGFAVRPGLSGPVMGLRLTQAGSGGGNFVLRRSSALRRRGLDLMRLFRIWPGAIDYSGHRISVKVPNVGAQ